MTPTYVTNTFLVLSALLLGACGDPSGDLGDYTGSGDETSGDAETTTTMTTAETTAETTTGTPPEATTTTTTTTGAEECPLEEAADQCCCFTFGGECEEPTQVLCEATVACDDIQRVFAGDLVENPEALECALTALRDRTPGQIRVMYRYGLADPVDQWLFLYVQADGTVFSNEGLKSDDAYITELVHRELPAAEVFEQCLLEPDVATRVACVEMALYGSEAIETCLPRCDTGVP